MLSDHCKDTNRTVLHILNQIIEMLNASSLNVGNPKLRDFSRLGNNFPLHTIDEVENFEKQLKQDESLMELYVSIEDNYLNSSSFSFYNYLYYHNFLYRISESKDRYNWW